MKRVGILGGTFDPPHTGHLTLALEALQELDLDQVVWIPAAVSPHKMGQHITAGSDRLEMVRLMTAQNEHFSTDDREMNRPGPSFTIDTLEELGCEWAETELFLILGEDSLRSFERWQRPNDIRRLAKLVVYRRLDSGIDHLPEHDILLTGSPVSISSTEIRNRIHRGQAIDHLVISEVEAYIHAHGLYLSS
ncbi:MAG: nicotinate (nicotinamide) nucleotide adenylyltransferase [Bacteroidetes Order II. Incertae sedis bacterium]|jgi:nicotinate-nucleotide adenylyltransferase|nr:nicotinate (nicotinamide) nucleotide adenylyltransferase [Bacteroidetes Order II. bacterium]MBT4053335.1 nicotinate (nicotinamide) nucleotide adenylyltransferase [Bacteroidetes Order II. bacterium]MBT4601633.1 nicotinate (nicotinamide) nucleotide adenylyltransferase [Bacteroidetes Order II. bacterium]MBT5249963.1 nicotinate (nicotinamide) nucleotide adenylyltransferase [Bacteroidetes Order II. bacterium]MBT6200623.1 nicotinate (nicotinamide) nucleotide adenylyltransferase [Bacteroidetes Orde